MIGMGKFEPAGMISLMTIGSELSLDTKALFGKLVFPTMHLWPSLLLQISQRKYSNTRKEAIANRSLARFGTHSPASVFRLSPITTSSVPPPSHHPHLTSPPEVRRRSCVSTTSPGPTILSKSPQDRTKELSNPSSGQIPTPLSPPQTTRPFAGGIFVAAT